MKYLLPIIFLLTSVYVAANDTLIYGPSITLDAIFSSYDNVDVYSQNTITLDAGFTFSSNGNGAFIANADPWNVEEPDEILQGTIIDSAGILDGRYVVGTINGQPGVNSAGAATYNIPIDVPIGNKGMVPRLSVNYNSHSEVGIMGRGWNLSGISSIVATGKVMYYDNESSGISSDDIDCRVVWDGQRLLTQGDSGLTAKRFYTEVFSNSKIVRSGSGNSSWFKIQTQNGQTLEYGNSEDSRIAFDGSTQWKWMLTKAYDRNGNTIEFSYTVNDTIGEILLSEIQYGGSTLDPVNTISLHYATKEDVQYGYINNDLVFNNKILDSISIVSDDSYYGSYGFHYDNTTDETLLSEIIQYDRDNHRYNSTKVTWEAPSFTINPTATTQSIQSGESNYKYFTGDFTGDGFSDLVSVQLDLINDNCKYYLYKGSTIGFNNEPDEEGDLPVSYTRQFWDDLTYAFDNNCTGTAYPTYKNLDVTHVFAGDFDGDGIDELFLKTLEWDDLAADLPADLTPGFETQFIQNFISNHINYCHYSAKMIAPVTMSLHTGIGKFMNFDKISSSPDRLTVFRLGDSIIHEVNNTPLPDIAGYGYSSFPDNNKMMYYDSENDTALIYSTVSRSQFWGEFNGDTKPDYIKSESGTYEVYCYDNSTSSFDLEYTIPDTVIGLIDLNGDGISAWLALASEDYTTMRLDSIWENDEYYSSGDITDNDLWDEFLNEHYYNPSHYYNFYVHFECSYSDNEDCRTSFLVSDTGHYSLGRELYLEHLSGNGPTISFGYLQDEDTQISRGVAADINANGKNDLLLLYEDSLKYIFYDFVPTFEDGEISYDYTTQEVAQPLGRNTQLGDFNGDGIIELICPDNNKHLTFITDGSPGKKITSITNGLGIETRYSYKPLTDASVYTAHEDASFPVIDITSPWYVVNSISSDNGVADSLYVEYDYEGAKVHLQGKGFLGFMRTEAENDLLNNTQISNLSYDNKYFQTYPGSDSLLVDGGLYKRNTTYVSFDSIMSLTYRYKVDSIVSEDLLYETEKTTTFDYNNDGLVEEKTNKVGSLATITENTSYTSAGWHVSALPQLVTREYKRGSDTERDSVFYAYESSAGNLTQKIDFYNTDREFKTRYRSFDSFGNPDTIVSIGKRGQLLSVDSVQVGLAYSEDGRFLVSKSSPLDFKERYSYDLSTGLINYQTAPNRKNTYFEYGPFNRLKKKISQDQSEDVSLIAWNIENDPEGSLYYSWTKSSSTPAVLTYYDVKGRELRTVSIGFGGDTIYVDTEYDSQGRVLRKSMPYFTSGTPLWTNYTYDDYGRPLTISSPDTTTTTYSYSDLETTTTISKASDSYSTSTLVNALGEVIQSEDNDNNIVYHNYFPDGKLNESYTNSHSSLKTILTYDEQGNRTSIEDPDAGTITSSYDAFGLLLYQINAKGDTSIYSYDKTGRVIEQEDNRGSIYYSYMTDTTNAAFGLSDSVYNEDKSLMDLYSYDSQTGSLVTQTRIIPGKTFTNTYTYDWFGRIMTRTYPSGFETQYEYSSFGDLESIKSDEATLWNCSDVNALGQITSYSQGSYTTSVSYSTTGELNRVTTGSIFDMKYGFDNLGNLEFREDHLTNQREEFEYDNLNRLNTVTYYDNGFHDSSGDLSIGYDNCGNITSKTGISSTINYGEGAGPHALTSIMNPDTAYHPPTQYITYTCFNKVASISDTLDGGIPLDLDFSYGLNNQRIKSVQTRDGSIERIKYFNSDYVEDSTASGLKKYHYIYGGNGLAAIFVEQNSTDSLYFVMSDHLGSPATIVNASSSHIERYSFNAWGVPRDPDDWTTEFTGELFSGRGFTGHEHLEEFNLINMNGRVYDPAIGRFLSPDPIVQSPNNPNNYNRYSYVLNNPLTFTDPSGYYVEQPKRTKMPGMYVTKEACFGWEYQSRDPWFEPYQSSFYGTAGGAGGPFDWRYNWGTGNYDNWNTGGSMSASVFGTTIAPTLGTMLSPEATGFVINAMKSLNSQANAINSLTVRSWNLPLMQARGFDNHIFQYNRETGLFYAPWTDVEVDPLAILAMSLVKASDNMNAQIRAIHNPEMFTYISESPPLQRPPIITPALIAYQTTSAGHTKGNGPIHIKNGIRLYNVVARKGPFFAKALNNGWMVGVGNFSFGITDRMFTTNFKSVLPRDVAGWDAQYFSVTNQYQLNWSKLGYYAAVAAFPALLELSYPFLFPAL